LCAQQSGGSRLLRLLYCAALLPRYHAMNRWLDVGMAAGIRVFEMPRWMTLGDSEARSRADGILERSNLKNPKATVEMKGTGGMPTWVSAAPVRY